MAYRFESHESVKDTLIRVAREQIGKYEAALADNSSELRAHFAAQAVAVEHVAATAERKACSAVVQDHLEGRCTARQEPKPIFVKVWSGL